MTAGKIVERLRAYDSSCPKDIPCVGRGTRTVYPLVNPDGPEAADFVEQQAATITSLTAEVEARDGDLAFIWKWIERAIFDDALPAKDCLATLAEYPGAPWKTGRWNVDHKPYCEMFYKRYPLAAIQPTDTE
jgi:hypothetical protein